MAELTEDDIRVMEVHSKVPRPLRKHAAGCVPPAPPRRQTDHFIRGPIPEAWIQAAMALDPSAWRVGTVLWRWQGVTHDAPIVLSRAKLRAYHVHRNTAADGLRHLEEACLVHVERCHGKSPRVLILT